MEANLMSRVLVTGGSGFIGHYWCEHLAREGVDVTVLDLVAPAWLPDGARDVRGDVRDPAAVASALEGCDAVLHLAAAHHDFGLAERTYFDVNQGGAEVLAAEMDRAGVGRLCFYSSVAVYGDVPEPTIEAGLTRPESPYGASKLAGEDVFRRWTAQGGGRRALVIRPTAVCGPGNFSNVFTLMRQIHSGFYLPVGRGENVKSLAYVENLVEATAYLWARDDLPPFDVYNYVDKPDLTSRQICETIAASVGRRPPRWSLPLGIALAAAAPFDVVSALFRQNLSVSRARVRKLGASRTCFDAGKVRAAGFTARISLAEGLRRMGAWYLAEGRRQPVVSHLPPARVGDPSRRSARAAGA
jgi:nucleoside-diphosphate-sugar epimerase